MAYIYIVKRFPIVGGVKPKGWPNVAGARTQPAPAHS
jgi:hypothetical protein